MLHFKRSSVLISLQKKWVQFSPVDTVKNYLQLPGMSGFLKHTYGKTHRTVGSLLRRLHLKSKPIPPLQPHWETITRGPLEGRQLYCNPQASVYWQEMLNGRYDAYIYEALAEFTSLNSKVVWDVGAHIGIHTLTFASLVGSKGKVFAFEPNRYNVERLKLHINHNQDLAKRVIVFDCALAEQNGQAEFIFTDEVDNTTSSGSHLSLVEAPEKPEVYQRFIKEIVRTMEADTLLARHKVYIPDVLKIDVEGAESLVLEGARGLLAKYHPLLAIEVHNITQMYFVQQLLHEYQYTLELLDTPQDSVSRGFIVGHYHQK